VSGPAAEIVCVDCGGRAHLITFAPEEGGWEAGDVVSYRCSDCLDRWDLVLESDDLEQ
jgi:DNA-directed RNA polymerase subunit RPC12/RpoP